MILMDYENIVEFQFFMPLFLNPQTIVGVPLLFFLFACSSRERKVLLIGDAPAAEINFQYLEIKFDSVHGWLVIDAILTSCGAFGILDRNETIHSVLMDLYPNAPCI